MIPSPVAVMSSLASHLGMSDSLWVLHSSIGANSQLDREKAWVGGIFTIYMDLGPHRLMSYINA